VDTNKHFVVTKAFEVSLFAAVFALVFLFCFRVGELTSAKKADPSVHKVLSRQDVVI